MENKLICRTCSEEAVMLCLCDAHKSRYCMKCLPDHLASSTDKAHTLLPLQAHQFIQTKREEKQFFKKMNILNELVGRVNSRLERLVVAKDQMILQIQLAAEELKRLVDKELETKIEEIRALSTKREYDLKALKYALEDMRYAKNIDKHSQAGKLLESRELAEQLLLEPLDFQLFTDPLLELLPNLVSYYFREIRSVNNKVVYPSDYKQSLSLYVPNNKNYTDKPMKTEFKLKRAMGCCCLPDGALFFAGGRVGNNSSKEAGLSDPSISRIASIEDMQHPRDSMALIYYENCLYVFGGWQAQTLSSIKDNEKFDLKRNEWSPISSFTEGMFNLTGISHQDLFYLAGCGSRLIYRYDPTYDSFVKLNLLLSIDAPVRLLPSLDDSIIVLQYDKLQVVKLENEAVVKESQVPIRHWWGPCAPVIADRKVFFLENSDIWEYDYSSSKLERLIL